MFNQSDLEQYRNQSVKLLQQFNAMREQAAKEQDKEKKIILIKESTRYLDENEQITDKIGEILRKMYPK